MEINVENFKTVLKKATLNNTIDSVQLNFIDGKIETKMINEENDAIIFLNVENDVLSTNDEVVFNFREPAQNLLPFLNIIDNQLINIDIQREKIVLKDGRQKANIFLSSPAAIRTFGSNPRELEFFTSLPLDESFIDLYKKIKKVGNRFGKVYFGVKDNTFFIETKDASNQFSNGLKFDISEVEKEDIAMMFSFKNFVSVMEVINGDAEDFTLNFAWVESQEKGAMVAKKNDDSETYFLMSKEE